MNIDEARALKFDVTRLYEDGTLIELLEKVAGQFAPNYDPSNSTSIILAAGRTEMMQTIRNLNRLTEEQIVDLFQEGQ